MVQSHHFHISIYKFASLVQSHQEQPNNGDLNFILTMFMKIYYGDVLRTLINHQTLTVHLSTLVALLAHLTKASSRINSCLVLVANCTISIFLSMSVFLGSLQHKSIHVMGTFVKMKLAGISMKHICPIILNSLKPNVIWTCYEYCYKNLWLLSVDTYRINTLYIQTNKFTMIIKFRSSPFEKLKKELFYNFKSFTNSLQLIYFITTCTYSSDNTERSWYVRCMM